MISDPVPGYYTGMKEVLVPTSCLGCAIRLVAFKEKDDGKWDSSAYASLLSDHVHVHGKSWGGRLRFAWDALKGNGPRGIELDVMSDIEEFKKGFDELYLWLKGEEED